MRPLGRSVLNTASGLATVLVALQSTQAAAGKEDPFALPGKDYLVDRQDPSDLELQLPKKNTQKSQAAGDYVFFADVEINGSKTQGIAKISRVGGELAIDSAFAFNNDLIDEIVPLEFVLLSSIDGIAYKFDQQFFRLTITKDLISTGRNLVDLQHRSRRLSETSGAIPALIVDYDLTVQADRDDVRALGLVSARIVHGENLFESSFTFNAAPGRARQEMTRLDSNFTKLMPESTSSITLGDFVSQTPVGSRAVRMGGLRYGTDFSVRPDLITQPLPDFVGTVAVPTGIDVLVNDRRIASDEVSPGEFTVRSIPVPFGRSEVGVIVRDALNRETLRTVPFYSSRSLLAPGLFEGAINVGAVRRRYGLVSNDYRNFAVSGMARRGMSRRFTLTVLGEATGKLANVGLGADVVLADAAIVNATVRRSIAEDGFGTRRSGTYASIGIESAGPVVSASVEARRVSQHYSDIASVSGDLPPPSLLAANLSFDLAEHGSLQLSAIRQSRPGRPLISQDGEKVRVLSASYRKTLGRDVFLSADLSNRSRFGRSEWLVLLGINVSLGNRTSAQASLTASRGSRSFQGGISRPDVIPGDTGYSTYLGLGAVDRIAASISRREEWGRLEAQAEHVGGSSALRVNARGSLVLAESKVFAVGSESKTFILVDSNGIGGLEIERDNRPAGTTSEDGKLLIGQAPAFAPIKIGLNTEQIPIDVIADNTAEYVSAAPRSVSRVQMKVARYAPVLLRLFDHKGHTFETGTRLIAMPSRTEYVVGFDSQIEINGAIEDTILSVTRANGSICHADLSEIEFEFVSSGRIPSLRCFMESRAFTLSRKAVAETRAVEAE